MQAAEEEALRRAAAQEQAQPDTLQQPDR
jgi:hypothetical protein